MDCDSGLQSSGCFTNGAGDLFFSREATFPFERYAFEGQYEIVEPIGFQKYHQTGYDEKIIRLQYQGLIESDINAWITFLNHGSVVWSKNTFTYQDFYGNVHTVRYLDHNVTTMMGKPCGYEPNLNLYALEFDGIDNYLMARNHLTLQFGTGDFSIEFWINSTGGGTEYFICKDSWGGAGKWAIKLNGSVRFRADTESTGNLWGSTNIQGDGIWHHVVIVKDDRDGYIYLDGTQDAFTANYFDVGCEFDSTADLYVGVDAAFNYYFEGKLDAIKFYMRTLTAQEVKHHRALACGRTGVCADKKDLIAAWDFNEGTSYYAHDYSRNDNDLAPLAATNMPTWIIGHHPICDVGCKMYTLQIILRNEDAHQ